MKILVASEVTNTLRTELRRAKRTEIGGVMVGEHIGEETFRIAEISVQRNGGSFAHFVRDPAQHREFLDRFFAKTGRDYSRFNYIGEWHSHPTMRPVPSGTDCATMKSIVSDPAVGAPFAVLLVARLHPWWGLQLSTTVFSPGSLPVPIKAEGDPGDRDAGRFSLLRMQIIRWV